MHDAARLSEIAEAKIDELTSEGYTLTPADIVRLNALAWNVENPDARIGLARGVPVSVGGVVLWPFTLRSYDWHRRVAGEMPTVWHGNVCLAYAFAHGYSEGNELDVTGLRALAAVTAWGVKLRCRMPELIEAMSQIIQQDETFQGVENPNSKPIEIGDLAASIAAHTGQSAEDIERRMAMNHALRILHYTFQAQERVEGNGKAMSAAAIRATQAMELYCIEIRERGK